ncbi:type I glutamate--ammonia ligase [Rickettsia prowazekii]|uniref:GS catalytic domain-containing protein n=2 Tax=Rickettsia prowazekii TaxID=782 RepID=Q9ZD52_RICPR|nr:glutamine synthetase [Rickettsia prowazekii]ADE30024.1 Glutamine synthetase [Rickettsia prowazekii str. Rp22]AFE49303.1 glutamine synthetase [Rickettsia prowazekii str. Chernikova]AFE50148.1 glutamine synthetase [Rickettsia prowazekii str. Katsinyian]AFE50994.1 glutamine synthetase [Rickettsia prowazekii str. BuV67-CWPP]AFE51830.1 glutamine synthetase [Rickettsia prowazekii str. Dachau]
MKIPYINYNNFINTLSQNLQKNKQLEKIIAQFYQNYQIIPIIGVEIEFYLSHNIDIANFEILSSKDLSKFKISKIKKEKGNNQFEIALPPSINLIQYIKNILEVKKILTKNAKQLNGYIDFSPKPFLDDYGNSMHFHINFNSELNDYYILAAQGICHYMLDTLLVFMPTTLDYLRINKKFMSPTHVSYGGNNRSVAVRTPNSLPKRLEHRLSSPETDPYIAMFTILKSILLALTFPNSLKKIEKIYGNAFDPQYNLTPLPTSYQESFRLFKPEFFK